MDGYFVWIIFEKDQLFTRSKDPTINIEVNLEL